VPLRILATMATDPGTDVRQVSPTEGERLLDEQARRYLGMTADEFARRWAAGELDPDDHPDVMRVAMLLPFAGR
jgi:hypothetical protein